MTNVITFKPKNQPAPEAYDLPEKLFTSTLASAMDIAGYVYRDLEAVDLLMAELNRAYRQNTPWMALSPEVMQKCAKYLACKEEDIDASCHIMYGS